LKVKEIAMIYYKPQKIKKEAKMSQKSEQTKTRQIVKKGDKDG